METRFDLPYDIDMAWCPGCGNYMIHRIMQRALDEMGRNPNEVVISSGIGQAAKIPQYINVNFFNGLHGRAIPVATAIKAANPELTVIAEGGDGDMYGEGGNHFIHAIRRNVDITNIVHNNMVYGLTKGQASPTSQKGFSSTLQKSGVFLEPFNPLAVAISLGATFVARAYSNDRDQAVEIVKKAIEHKGYALVDMFQPCVIFNKENNHKWFKENTYNIDENHDTTDRAKALEKAFETEKLPLGIFYQTEPKNTFVENQPGYKISKEPLYQRKTDIEKIAGLL